MSDTGLLFEGLGEAVGRDHAGEGPDVYVMHQVDCPLRDVESFQRLFDRPVWDCTEGRLQVQVCDVGGGLLTVPLRRDF